MGSLWFPMLIYVMERAKVILLAAVIMLAGELVASAIGYRGFLEACVCVVNALSRSLMCMAVSIAFGTIAISVDAQRTVLVKWVYGIQTMVFLLGLFFAVQHVFFLLEVV